MHDIVLLFISIHNTKNRLIFYVLRFDIQAQKNPRLYFNTFQLQAFTVEDITLGKHR